MVVVGPDYGHTRPYLALPMAIVKLDYGHSRWLLVADYGHSRWLTMAIVELGDYLRLPPPGRSYICLRSFSFALLVLLSLLRIRFS